MKKTPIIAACLLGALTFSSSLLAKETQIDSVIGTRAALEKAAQVHTADYTSIELFPGKANRMLYLAEGEANGRQVLTVLDAKTGKDITAEFNKSDKSLTQAIDAVSNTFSGKVVSAYKEFIPHYETVYAVELQQEEQELIVLLDPNTLQVIEVETFDDSMEEPEAGHTMGFFEQHPGDDW
ncbi:PepSY domain-containing protein [Photobacterium sp. OFAV2-7]|uniref:PepSY domain-containing protein n=1 Tax=Photobacterium sp. OFAV2-7 TaxID=2917748 RepID=UPI001EF495EE|nr:PepSY domain-containing protein [Photobacterium sp. OFAV2-7]MCG7586887.1 PepSY domain-containing protein [Photobacterium sp. OFAV2-7]